MGVLNWALNVDDNLRILRHVKHTALNDDLARWQIGELVYDEREEVIPNVVVSIVVENFKVRWALNDHVSLITDEETSETTSKFDGYTHLITETVLDILISCREKNSKFQIYSHIDVDDGIIVSNFSEIECCQVSIILKVIDTILQDSPGSGSSSDKLNVARLHRSDIHEGLWGERDCCVSQRVRLFCHLEDIEVISVSSIVHDGSVKFSQLNHVVSSQDLEVLSIQV